MIALVTPLLFKAAVILVGTSILGFAMTFAARCAAPCCGMIDRPDGSRKLHGKPMPLMGGVAIFATIALGLLAVRIWSPTWLMLRPDGVTHLPALLISTCLFCCLGVVDDRWGMRARYKFIGQVLACLPFALWSRPVESVELLGLQVDLGWWSVAFTVFWLVACSNVINLIDGMDGLAGSISVLALSTIAGLSAIGGQPQIALLALVAAGSVVGFLGHNWPPAKIFMGDSGSLMLGFLIGALAIEAALKQAACFTLIVPLVLISVPVFDTSMAILRRKLSGRSIGHADRGHLHHRLQDRGLSRTQSLLIMGGLSSLMAAIAVVSYWLRSDLLAIGLCCSLLTLLIVGRVFGHHETSLLIDHFRALGRLVHASSRSAPIRLLAVRLSKMEADRKEEYWDLVCSRLAACGVGYLEFQFSDLKGEQVFFRRVWNEADRRTTHCDGWQLRRSLERDGEILATVRAAGVLTRTGQSASIDDVSQLLNSLCQGWPLEDLLFGEGELPEEQCQSAGRDIIRLETPRTVAFERQIPELQMPERRRVA